MSHEWGLEGSSVWEAHDEQSPPGAEIRGEAALFAQFVQETPDTSLLSWMLEGG